MPTLKCSLEIDAPAGEVWRVLTTPELVKEWAGAYVDGLSIRTSWREGEPVAWKGRDGSVQASGTVAAFRPDRLLKFDFHRGPLDEPRSFSETFEIEPISQGSRLEFTTGPMAEDDANAMRRQAEQAIGEIKSLAEESAQIHRQR